jgi:DNA-binding transcriptional ArsR family regulator
MVEQLSVGPATVSELARPLAISLAAVVQHVQVLEACGLVRTEKKGRTRTCRIEPATLAGAERWIAERRSAWERHLDRLGERSVAHATFVIERTYDAPPSRVFEAFASREAEGR